MLAVCVARAETYRTEVFDFYRPTCEEARAEILSRDYYTVVQEYPAANCTVLYGVIDGIPHSPYYNLDVVWFDGSTESLPLPARNAWGADAEPDAICLSEDGYTLYYEVTFSEQMVMDKGLESEYFIHDKGTYFYTVDLLTGEVTLTITDDETPEL